MSHPSCVSASAAHSAAATNGSYGHYGYDDEEWDDGFPPPPSPGSVEEMSRDLPLAPPLRQRYPPPTHLTIIPIMHTAISTH